MGEMELDKLVAVLYSIDIDRCWKDISLVYFEEGIVGAQVLILEYHCSCKLITDYS